MHAFGIAHRNFLTSTSRRLTMSYPTEQEVQERIPKCSNVVDPTREYYQQRNSLRYDSSQNILADGVVINQPQQ